MAGQASAPALRNRLDGLAHASSVYILIYVTTSLSAERRRRLIEQKVAFIFPGKQLYLPTLGIDLRERFGSSKTESRLATTSNKSSLTPSAQASLIAMMISAKFQRDWSAMELASSTHMSVSTARMALGELLAAGAVKHIDPVDGGDIAT